MIAWHVLRVSSNGNIRIHTGTSLTCHWKVFLKSNLNLMCCFLSLLLLVPPSPIEEIRCSFSRATICVLGGLYASPLLHCSSSAKFFLISPDFSPSGCSSLDICGRPGVVRYRITLDALLVLTRAGTIWRSLRQLQHCCAPSWCSFCSPAWCSSFSWEPEALGWCLACDPL